MKMEASSEFFTAEEQRVASWDRQVSAEELEHTGPLAGSIRSRPSGACWTARATLAPLSTVLLVLANTA